MIPGEFHEKSKKCEPEIIFLKLKVWLLQELLSQNTDCTNFD